jgi:hypothetical protein
MKDIKLYHKILLLILLLLVIYGMWYFETGCLVERFLNTPCLTCGMTRAFFALINGNISLAFKIHPMLFSVPILIIMFLFSDRLFNGNIKKYSVTLLILIVSGFVLNYFRNL